LLGTSKPRFAQAASDDLAKSDSTRHRVAISLLRSLNTAEVTYRAKNGSFVIWKTLVSSEPRYFEKSLAAAPPEILPGWNLRLNVHADGQGYDVLLQDMTDNKCFYAALTDETGVIRQSKAIDCEI
jgi:hypothetical protein